MTTCGTCKHWHKQDSTDVNNIGAPKRGICRFGPPHCTSLPNGAQTSSYPNLPANFPACAQHDAKLEIA